MGSWTCWYLRTLEAADNREHADDPVPFSDLKSLAAKYVNQVWQKEWNEAVIVRNKFYESLPKLRGKLLFL